MDKRSKNKFDVYNWIIKVINSATNIKHIVTCNKLINNYRKQYDLAYFDDLYRNLKDEVDSRIHILANANNSTTNN